MLHIIVNISQSVSKRICSSGLVPLQSVRMSQIGQISGFLPLIESIFHGSLVIFDCFHHCLQSEFWIWQMAREEEDLAMLIDGSSHISQVISKANAYRMNTGSVQHLASIAYLGAVSWRFQNVLELSREWETFYKYCICLQYMPSFWTYLKALSSSVFQFHPFLSLSARTEVIGGTPGDAQTTTPLSCKKQFWKCAHVWFWELLVHSLLMTEKHWAAGRRDE